MQNVRKVLPRDFGTVNKGDVASTVTQLPPLMFKISVLNDKNLKVP